MKLYMLPKSRLGASSVVLTAFSIVLMKITNLKGFTKNTSR